ADGRRQTPWIRSLASKKVDWQERMDGWRRSGLRGRMLRQVVRVNLEEIRCLPPRGLRRSRLSVGRVGRLLVAALAIVLGSAAGSRFTEPPVAPPQAGPASRGFESLAGSDLGAEFSTGSALAGEAEQQALLLAPRAIDPAILRLAMRKIVIDAGHGGIDPGARTLGGMAEKDVAFDIARRLEVLLRDQGFAVAMTRESDETVSLRERSLRANRVRGDLFLSIHVNSLPQQDRRGVETYYLGIPSDRHGEWLAGEENAESGYSVADVRTVLEGVYTNMRANDSRAFAETVQRHIYDSLRRASPDLEDRGVKTAPFVVLVGTQMPAILAEVSCISNDREAALLEQPKHRQAIAEALAGGVRAYAASYERREVVASVSR
ncbi:MAG TPA: N-acetylmuramoyl-L-alanine amidase, partial [Candidatus Binatia bacterium]|nr:N-acetylmuramoyl-L-alanine amidase [Candidatus Binatia bacterium]